MNYDKIGHWAIAKLYIYMQLHVSGPHTGLRHQLRKYTIPVTQPNTKYKNDLKSYIG